jgi:very-short-patch-repair endonuclease
MESHTTETFIQTVRQNHGDIYSFEKSEYTGNDNNIIVTCVKHGCDIIVKATTLLSRTERNGGLKKNPVVGSCPECRKEYFKDLKHQMIEKFKVVHNNEYDYDENTYVNNETPYIAKCKIHGEFQIFGRNHVYGGDKCPKCYSHGVDIRKLKTIGDQKFYVCDTHGDVLIGNNRSIADGCPKCNIEKQKAINDDNLKKRLDKKYGKNYDIVVCDTVVRFYCKKHQTQTILTRKELRSKKDQINLCKKCISEYYQNQMADAKKVAEIGVQKIIAEEYQNIYKYVEFIDNGTIDKCRIKLLNIFTNKEKFAKIKTILQLKLAKTHRYVLRNYLPYEKARQRVRLLGITGFREYKKWYVRTQQTELPTNPQRYYKEWTSYCDFFGTNPKANMSWGEKRINDYLQRKGIEYVWQKRFKDCKDKNALPFDFYLPEYNLIVEFDGEQHYKPRIKFGGHDKFRITQKHDQIKNQYCKDHGIKIIRLTYDDLDNNVIEWSLDIELSKIY